MKTTNNNEERNILIVEGSVNAAETLSSYVKVYGFNSIVTIDPKEAMAILCDKTRDIACIILDVSIAEAADGLDIISKAKGCRSGTPVVVVSGLSDESIIKAAISNGASDYLIKPVPSSRLHNVISKLTYQIDKTVIC